MTRDNGPLRSFRAIWHWSLLSSDKMFLMCTCFDCLLLPYSHQKIVNYCPLNIANSPVSVLCLRLWSLGKSLSPIATMKSAGFVFRGCFQTLKSRPVPALVHTLWHLQPYNMNFKIKRNSFRIWYLHWKVFATGFRAKTCHMIYNAAGGSDLQST